ncbi:hypothetical protein KP509_19G018600 [Ceratopteris richardii]|uniref:Uncharacterized protein n=1 Tax=Ceratopteris richardii TaxID=49495 RepID=A0A8T2SK61_CERRI|nr:hypothetical protein KP509_19G018600 [Ceratopteris richardii]KAH7351882.1 hypothetical protein KP509_19G018600 [Ceratopteris richardii]
MTMGSLKQMLSLVSPIEFQALQDICEYNDITEGQLICAPETITSIEMFMQGIPQICCLSFFQHLVSLSLIQQSIPYIEGLHNCPCLEILRLNENLIKRLDGLESCTRLRELYLHSNKIEHIKNISHLTDLEVLWLANNSIHEIGGLEHCVHLKELNVAQNPIKQVGEISKLKSLERLNAAATNIGSFKIRQLSQALFLPWVIIHLNLSSMSTSASMTASTNAQAGWKVSSMSLLLVIPKNTSAQKILLPPFLLMTKMLYLPVVQMKSLAMQLH